MGVLAVAAAWHDAGFVKDHTTQGFNTKEQYSAHLAEQFLKEYGEPPEFIDTVTRAIVGTTHNVEREDVHALVLHAADIANIGGPYVQFYRKSSLLYKEAGQFGETMSWLEWTRQGIKLVEGLVHEAGNELPRIGELTVGITSFPERALRNSRHLLKESRPLTD